MLSNTTYGLSVSAYGVANDGRHDASPGIQAALDSGSPLVHIPYGTYRIDKGLLISSHTRLDVHPEARLIFGDGAGRQSTDFLISNRNPDRGDTEISITGGIWDGNNRNNPRGQEGDTNAYTGALLNMKRVSGFMLRDMLLKDSTAYFTRLSSVRNFRIEKIRFQITHLLRNQDGIHCAGNCENGHIHDLRAQGTHTTGDDMVALNADDALLRSELLGAEAGPIRNLSISDIRADDCHSFVRLASVWSEISDIDIRGVMGGCRCMALNADAARYCRLPLFDPKDPAYGDGVGRLRNIRFAEAQIHKTSAYDRALFCLETRMDNLQLVNIRRTRERDAIPDAPLVVMDNVLQDTLHAEYRRRPLREPAHQLKSVAGNADVVREESRGRIRSFNITDSDHILEFTVGAPVIRDLPPANHLIGLPRGA